MNKNQEVVNFIRSLYLEDFIPLHRPIFVGNEKKYLNECIDSNFVSSVGAKVGEFENKILDFTGSKFAIATINGTAALHIALKLVGVESSNEVLTQALSFVATSNAISYLDAHPVYLDVDLDTMGMSPIALNNFLSAFAEKRNGLVYNKSTGRRISACVPMHTFGLPCRILEISTICSEWGIPLIEDAAESLGSSVENKHTGTFGKLGTLSFNGNKVITTGGGGMIITDDENIAKLAKHLTTTAKISHAFEFEHDQVGFNYRLPNINAALGCAQMENLEIFLALKLEIFEKYSNFFNNLNLKFARSLDGTKSNYWLNSIIFNSSDDKLSFLNYANKMNVMARPIWKLMTDLIMFKNCYHDGLTNSKWLEARVVNIPSSVPNFST